VLVNMSPAVVTTVPVPPPALLGFLVTT
jgi:hypothetical protein